MDDFNFYKPITIYVHASNNSDNKLLADVILYGKENKCCHVNKNHVTVEYIYSLNIPEPSTYTLMDNVNDDIMYTLVCDITDSLNNTYKSKPIKDNISVYISENNGKNSVKFK